MSEFLIINPKTRKQFSDRNRLLQESLRPSECPFKIEDEYPLVLAEDFADRSFCMYDNNRNLLGHLSLLIRTFSSPYSSEPLKIALIGNVATLPSMRGRGLMRTLFDKIEVELQATNAKAIILWSDLTQFYQKLGYSAFGAECRLSFETKKLPQLGNQFTFDFNLASKNEISQLNLMRTTISSCLGRSDSEFHSLLKIPGTALCQIKKGGQIQAYAIMGRGWDMVGVIHEWACLPNAVGELESAFKILGQSLGLEEIMVLAPGKPRQPGILSQLIDEAKQIEKNSIGFIKILQEDHHSDFLKTDVYFWGLDSI